MLMIHALIIIVGLLKEIEEDEGKEMSVGAHSALKKMSVTI